MKKMGLIVAFAAAISLSIFGCGGNPDSNGKASEGSAGATGSQQDPVGAAGAREVQEVTAPEPEPESEPELEPDQDPNPKENRTCPALSNPDFAGWAWGRFLPTAELNSIRSQVETGEIVSFQGYEEEPVVPADFSSDAEVEEYFSNYLKVDEEGFSAVRFSQGVWEAGTYWECSPSGFEKEFALTYEGTITVSLIWKEKESVRFWEQTLSSSADGVKHLSVQYMADPCLWNREVVPENCSLSSGEVQRDLDTYVEGLDTQVGGLSFSATKYDAGSVVINVKMEKGRLLTMKEAGWIPML